MKKILLSVALLVAGVTTNAQDLVSQTFDDLTVGDLGTDLTGAAKGQGGWITYAETGTTQSFQIVNLAGTDNALLLTSTDKATTSLATVFFAEQDLRDSWGMRTSGNNIVLCNFSLFTGVTTGAAAVSNARLYNAAGGTIGGFSYNGKTRSILAQVNITRTDGSKGVASFYLKESGDLILDENTWYDFAFMFDKTTGDMYYTGTATGIAPFRIPGGTTTNTGTNIGQDPLKFSLYSLGATGNTMSEEFLYDNVRVRAQVDTNLSVANNKPVMAYNTFAVYPNPATNFLNINGDTTTFNEVKVTDLNGRVVKNVKFEGVTSTQLNVSELSSGMYIINIYSNEGVATEKFMKQ